MPLALRHWKRNAQIHFCFKFWNIRVDHLGTSCLILDEILSLIIVPNLSFSFPSCTRKFPTCQTTILNLYHHCGIENLSKNNFIHRTVLSSAQIEDTPNQFGTVWAGCEDNDRGHSYPQDYENQRNIYLLDDVEDFLFARSHDRFYDSSPNFHHNLYWSLAPGDARVENKM